MGPVFSLFKLPTVCITPWECICNAVFVLRNKSIFKKKLPFVAKQLSYIQRTYRETCCLIRNGPFRTCNMQGWAACNKICSYVMKYAQGFCVLFFFVKLYFLSNLCVICMYPSGARYNGGKRFSGCDRISLLVLSITFYFHYNLWGCMCSTGPFQYRWLKGHIYSTCHYHHQIGSIHLSHCYIFPWLCAWDVCYIIFCHLLHIRSGKPGICFRYYCAVYDECK